VAADLDYARSLAVSNGSKYQVTFELVAQSYTLRHSGSDSSLHILPPSPFRRPGDSPQEHIVELAGLPRLSATVELAGLRTTGFYPQTVTDVEFNSLGALTRSDPTSVWLACGQGATRLYVPVEVDPVTGLATVGEIQTTLPVALNP
jgi:hypothetical protein